MRIALMYRNLGRSAGGIEASLYNLASTLLRKGHEVRAIVPCKPDVVPEDAMPPGVPVTWLDIPEDHRPLLPGHDTRRRLRLYVQGLHRAIDGVDAFWTRGYLSAMAASRAAGGRSVIFIQTGPESDYWRITGNKDTWLERVKLGYRCRAHDWYDKKAMEGATHLVYLSKAARNETMEKLGRTFLSKSQVIPLGVNLERFKPAESPRPWNGCLRTITVCRMSPEKNLGCLIRAVALLKASNVHVESLLVGDGPMQEEWQALTRELSVQDRVFFLGRQRLVEEFYRKADVFILPSVYESYGNAYIEAFASGLPAIALRRREPDILVAAGEVIDEGLSGLLVDDNSPELLAGAMKQMYDAPDTMHQWGRNARHTAETYYDREVTVDRLLALSAGTAASGNDEHAA